MVARFRAIAVVGVGLAILLTNSAAPAAPQANNPYNLREPKNTPMTKCMTEVGAVWNAYKRRNLHSSNAQRQAHMACLDRIANPHMKKR